MTHSVRPAQYDIISAPSASTLALLSAGVPPATRRAYRADRADWEAFCDLRGQTTLPTTDLALAEYVAHLLTIGSPNQQRPRPLSPATVERRLAAISTWSQERGYGRPELRAAKLALRGQRRTVPTAKRQVAPVTTSVLRALVAQAADGGGVFYTPRAVRDRAIMLLGFALAARRSELVALDLRDVLERAEGLLVHIQRAKTGDAVTEAAVPWAASANLCPVRATVAWRTLLEKRGVTDGPLFRRVTRGGAIPDSRLTAQSVRLVIVRHARQAAVPVPAGFGPYSAHGLRRGMATESRRAGHDSLAIARQGGWADNSSALAVYLSDVDKWEGNALHGVL